MTDYIKTIETLQNMVANADGDEFIALRAAIDAVLQVKAFEEAEQGKWIPVEKQLPELHEKEVDSLFWNEPETYLISNPVLVTGKRERGPEDDPPVLVGFLERDILGSGSIWEDIDCNRLIHVTAWQPLPEAYKGGEQ